MDWTFAIRCFHQCRNSSRFTTNTRKENVISIANYFSSSEFYPLFVFELEQTDTNQDDVNRLVAIQIKIYRIKWLLISFAMNKNQCNDRKLVNPYPNESNCIRFCRLTMNSDSDKKKKKRMNCWKAKGYSWIIADFNWKNHSWSKKFSDGWNKK